MLGTVFLIRVDRADRIRHVAEHTIQRHAERVDAALETFEQVRGHELTHTSLPAPDGQAFDFVIVEVLAHARFEHELGRGVQREGEPFQLVIDLVVRHVVAFRGQRRADGLRAETFREAADCIHIVMITDVAAAARDGDLIEDTEEIEVEHVHQTFGVAFLRFEFRPDTVSLLRVAEHHIDIGGKPEPPGPFIAFVAVAQFELVLQIAETIVHRGGGEHKHLCRHAGMDDLVEELLVSVFFVVGLDGAVCAIAEVVRLIDDDEIIVAPVDPFNRDVHNRIAPRAAQIRMEQHIVTQMVAGDWIVRCVRPVRDPVVLELLRAQNKHVAVAGLEVLDHGQCGERLAQTDRIGQDAAVVCFELVDDCESRVLLEVVQLVPDQAFTETGAFLR